MTQLKTPSRSPSDPSVEWIKGFQKAVLDWYDEYGRDFPWRSTSNPFWILIAEVLLRQTQADRVVTPYLELTGLYPDPQRLAQADIDRLRGWFRPLGLSRRADMLVEASNIIVEEYGGNVPLDLQTLMRLPGLGRYSARAILCLSAGHSGPLIDEASGRMLRRILARPARGPAYLDGPLLDIVLRVVPFEDAKRFNLGLIDVASRYCRPRSPACRDCPLAPYCAVVRQHGGS